MGLLIKGEIDTITGSTTSLYLRVDQITIQRESNRMLVSTTLWKGLKDKYNPGENIPGSIVYYKDIKDEGEELEIPLGYRFDLTQKIYVREPIYKKKLVKEEVPYVSFDKNGDEITKYRTIEVEKNVLVEEKEQEIEVSNFQLIQTDIFKTVYDRIYSELIKILPEEIIEHV